MSLTEVARYNRYWKNNKAPKFSPPNSRMIWYRTSARTGRTEKSIVTYDNVGRMNYRIDFSTHMRPMDHSNPHLHYIEYGLGFDPIRGKETLINFW